MEKSKKVIVSLRTDIMPGREQLIGVFRFVKSNGRRWNLTILSHLELAASLRNGKQADADGFIVSETPPQPVRHVLSSLECPVVTIDSPTSFISRARQVVNIELDNAGIGRMGAAHFLAMGRFMSYAFVPAKENRHWSHERASAFQHAVKGHGLGCSVFTPEKDPPLANWLLKLPKPAAVMVACDRRMIEVLEACREADISIPEQLALLGVDNEEMYCNFTDPTLSSIDPGLEIEGIKAAAALDRLMCARKPRKSQTTLLPPRRVVQRESTSALLPAALMIRKAKAFIDGNATKGIKPSDVAREMHVSRRLAELRFHQLNGKTIRETIIERQLTLAKRLLDTTPCTIGEIVTSCGFSNRRQFERLFRKHFGNTARDNRKAESTHCAASHL